MILLAPNTRYRSTALAAALLASAGCASADARQPPAAGETQAIPQEFRTSPVLGTIGINSSGVLTTIQSATQGQRLGGWLLALADEVPQPGMIGDFDNDGFDDFVIRSGWGIGILGNTSTDTLTSKALTQFGTNIGNGWTLAAGDQVVAVGKFGSTSNPAMMVLKGSTGFAFVRANAGGLQAVTVVAYGTSLWDSATQVAWIVGGADKVHTVGRFEGGTDNLVVSSAWGWGIWVPGFTSAMPRLQHIAPNGENFGGWVLDTLDLRLKIVSGGDLDNASDARMELVAVGKAGLVVLHKKSTGAWGTGSMDTRFFRKDGQTVASGVNGTLHWLARISGMGGSSQKDLLFQTQNGIVMLEKSSTAWSFNTLATGNYGAVLGSWTFDGADVLAPFNGNFNNSGPWDSIIYNNNNVGFLTISGTGFATLAKAAFSTLSFDEPERMVGTGKFDHSGRSRVLFKNITPPVNPPSAAVLTYHNNMNRTGLNSQETALTADGVRTGGMSLQYGNLFTTDVPAGADSVSTQVLYAPSVRIRGLTRNPFFVTTMRNQIYSWNLDDGQFLYGYEFNDPEGGRPIKLGISGTPVVDYSTKTMYFVAATGNKEGAGGGGEDPSFNKAFWLVAFNIETERFTRWVKIDGSYPHTDGTPEPFLARNQFQRPGLLLNKGSIYIGFGSRWQEFANRYHGWIFRYDAQTFEQLGLFNSSPNETASSGGRGSGIWGGGAGIVGDNKGQIYTATGNGPVDPANGTYGDYFLKLGPRGYTLQLRKASPGEPVTGPLLDRDWDLGAGAPLVLESANRLIGGGKEGKYYNLNADTFASIQTPVQAYNNVFHNPGWKTEPTWTGEWWWGSPHLHGQPVYWNGLLFQQSELDYLKSYRLSSGTLGTSPAGIASDRRSTPYFPYMKGHLAASSNGNTAGSALIWSTLQARDDAQVRANPSYGCRNGIIQNRISAHKAEDLTCLWSTVVPELPKLSPPTVVAGKLILVTAVTNAGANREVRVYRLGGNPGGCPSPALPPLPSNPCP